MPEAFDPRYPPNGDDAIGPMTYLHDNARPFELTGPRPDGVVLLHGWTGSPAHKRMLGDFLHGRGFTVVAPALAGHATDPADMAGTGWRDWVRSASEAARVASADGRRLHFVGLSMGGLLSLLLAPQFRAASVTTINAPMLTRRRFASSAHLLKHVRPFHEWEAIEPPPGDGAAYWHQYAAAPLSTVPDLLYLMRTARRHLGRVTCPLLVIQSRIDETVRPESARIIVGGVASASKRLVWLERSRHVSTVDGERDVIHRAVLDHLAAAAVHA
jgi:carboxylesterase